VVGSIILMDETTLNISIPLIGGTALVSAAFFIWVLSRLVAIRRRKVITGEEEMIGMEGAAIEDFVDNKGRVWLHGESWYADSTVPVRKDDLVTVTDIQGLRLKVEPAPHTDANKGVAT